MHTFLFFNLGLAVGNHSNILVTAQLNTRLFVLPNTFGDPVKDEDTHSDADSRLRARVEEKAVCG